MAIQEFTLQRTGRAPLVFTGELLAKGSSQNERNTTLSKRWHEVAVYRADPHLVLAVAFRTQWKGELDHFDVYQLDRAAQVEPQLAVLDPTEHVVGFPPGAQFVKKQERLLRDIRAGWSSLMSTILSASSDFAERLKESNDDQ